MEYVTDIVYSLSEKRGFLKVSDLARAMGRKPTTFLNNLRYFAKSLNYQSKFAKDLFEALKISSEEFKGLIDQFSQGRSMDYLRFFDQKANSFTSMGFNYWQELFDLINSLQAGDVIIQATQHNPAEFYNERFQALVFDKIKHGVSFRYIFPDKEQSVIKLSYGWFHAPDPANTFDWKDFELAFNTFLNKIIELASNDKEMVKKAGSIAKTAEYVRRELKGYYMGDVILLHPLNGYTILKIAPGRATDYYILQNAYVGKSYSVLSLSETPIFYPLPAHVASRIGAHADSLMSFLDECGVTKDSDVTEEMERKYYEKR